MRSKVVILLNGTRDEACKKFDEARSTITDFNIETVSIRGDIRNHKEGWSVVKIYK